MTDTVRVSTDGGDDLTPIQQEAADELDDIKDRMVEIEHQIDTSEVWDPGVDSSPEEKELAEEYDRLVSRKNRLEQIVERGLP